MTHSPSHPTDDSVFRRLNGYNGLATVSRRCRHGSGTTHAPSQAASRLSGITAQLRWSASLGSSTQFAAARNTARQLSGRG